MSGRNFKRMKVEEQRQELARQARYADIETPVRGKPVQPGLKRVIVTLPGYSPHVVSVPEPEEER